MEFNHTYPFSNIYPEPEVRQRLEAMPVQMDLSQTHMGHQMHDQQDSHYSGGSRDLEGGYHQVEPPPFQANLFGSTSSWTPYLNMNDSLRFQATDPPGSYNGDLEHGYHQVESPLFQANLSGSMPSWTPHRNMNDSLQLQTTYLPESKYDEMGFGPDYQSQGMDFQPMWLPSADAVAPMPQVDYGQIAGYMTETREQLKKYCKERDIKTSRTRTKGEFVELAQPVLPGVDCWALRKSELRVMCKAVNVPLPHDTQHDSKAVMAQKLVKDNARWGIQRLGGC